MGKGSAKGKKGSAAGCPGSPEEKCVSEEVQPRHYVYVGKVPATGAENPGATKGKHTKGCKGAMKGDAEKGKGKSSGKAADKGKGNKGDTPSGSSPPNTCGKGRGDFETPTPKRRSTECLASGTPPTRPNPNASPTHAPNDPKLAGTGTPKGHGCKGSNKGGEEPAQIGTKGVKGAGVDQGAKDALDQNGKGKNGTAKGAVHQSDGKGSNAADVVDQSGNGSMAKGKGKTGKGIKGPAEDQNAGTLGAVDPSAFKKGTKGTAKGAVDPSAKGAVDPSGAAKGTKGAVKGGLDHKGKGKKGTAKGAHQSGGKGSNGADAVDPSRDTMDQMSGKDKKGDQAGKGKTKCDQPGKGKTKCDQPGKGKTKCDQPGKGKTKCDQAGKTKCDQAGKGKTKCDQAGKGEKGATHQDGQQSKAALTDEERKHIQALSGPGDIPLVQRKAVNEALRRRMKSGQGLRKGLVAQWAATPPNSMARFEFLKAFLLDREGLASITVEPFYEELSENKDKETYTEMPLCLIKEKYEKLPGGPAFIQSIVDSQAGKKHPQFDSKDMVIYKVFDSIKSISCSVAVSLIGAAHSTALVSTHDYVAQVPTSAELAIEPVPACRPQTTKRRDKRWPKFCKQELRA
ncbi:unnamed protein product [Symbiodinium sp. CCMP2456]|nr:unnamed protein product [Symbiodinium sp. CCMP2456]